jgi:hypothetical protein
MAEITATGLLSSHSPSRGTEARITSSMGRPRPNDKLGRGGGRP